MNYSSLIKKSVFYVLFIMAMMIVFNIFHASWGMETGSLGVKALNGGNADAVAVTASSHVPDIVLTAMILLGLGVGVVTYKKELKLIMNKIKSVAVLFVAFGLMASMTGCVQPYEKPEFENVGNNETAFVIQAEGNSENQDVFKSADLLAKSMVAAKRIPIPHRWVQQGRLPNDGIWMRSVIVIKVDRSPVTRVWTDDNDRGTTKNKEALEAESRDSLSVSSGFTLTAYITPEDAPKYLFRYKGDSLSTVVDTQIKNSIQAIYTRECAKYDLLELPKHKQDITDAIANEIIPFYKEWGITIAKDMGLVGGLDYDPAIQTEIDEVFKSQKKKERASADRVAQDEINAKNVGIAEANKQIAMINADGEAYAIQKKADAIKQAGSAYIQAQFIEKWDGIMPKVAGQGGVMQMLPAETLN